MRQFFIFGILLLAGVVSNYSQSAASQSTISGVVIDQDGAAIAGAKVDLSFGDTKQQSTITDKNGIFRFSQAVSGNYKITIVIEGFEPAAINVSTGAQPIAPLRISMQIANVRTEVIIPDDSAQISTEAADNKDSVALTEQTLSNLPVFDQDYIGAMSCFLDPGSAGNGGVTLVVNGMEVNSLGVSASTIKEIKINQDPYSAEFQRPGRGRI